MKSPLSIDAEKWDWQWNLVGNETKAETDKLAEMLTAAKAFVSDIIAGREARWLSFLGNPGCGKTHLADRIRWFLRDNGERIYNSTVRSDSDPRSENYLSCYCYAQEGAVMAKWGSIIDKARSSDFGLFLKACGDHYKIVDDLGVNSLDREGQATPFAIQKMAELLDRRLRKWTVVTSNFSRKELASTFDARISSRLMRNDSVIVDCSGVRDYAIRKELLKKAA